MVAAAVGGDPGPEPGVLRTGDGNRHGVKGDAPGRRGALVQFAAGRGIVAYVLLAVAYAWRFAGYRQEFLADARDPSRAFAFFTFTAASDMLAARLATTTPWQRPS